MLLKKNTNIKKYFIPSELTNIRDYIRWITSALLKYKLFDEYNYKDKNKHAWDEAVILVLDAIHFPMNTYHSSDILNAKITYNEKQIISEWLYKRIIQRMPLEYLTKNCWFANINFYVDNRVIIPRSPIGELIRNEFKPWIDYNKISTILDLCTGSGCIGIASFFVFNNPKVFISDVSKDALEIAKININKYKLNNIVTIIQSNLFQSIKNKFDLIISNPPYVNKNDYMPEEYKKEPTSALLAGNNGLQFIKEILIHSHKYLNPEGILILEVGQRKKELNKLFPNIPFTWINFYDGGDGVLIFSYKELVKYKEIFKKL